MIISFDQERESESPYVERVWSSHSESGGRFLSIAENRWEIVVSKLGRKATVLVRGPETQPTMVDCPPDGEWLGIRFKVGTCMPALPGGGLIDKAVPLPDRAGEAFQLDGSSWEIPDFENADAFIARLIRSGIVVRDPLVSDALKSGGESHVSPRSTQRRFLSVVGLTQTEARQIERARYAAWLLLHGTPILGAAFDAGYYDQPHLTRLLKRYIGLTPAQILRSRPLLQLSFLYRTNGELS